jgi:hypothetical protein
MFTVREDGRKGQPESLIGRIPAGPNYKWIKMDGEMMTLRR